MRNRIVVLYVLLLSVPAAAHDLYMVTGVPGAEKQLCIRIGEHFPDSMNHLALNRVTRFQLHGAGTTTELTPAADAEAKQTCAPIPEGAIGVAELLVPPVYIRIGAADFQGYIEGERFTLPVRMRAESKTTGNEGRELYSRYAKTILGAAGELSTQPLGHALEIVPEKSAESLRAGDEMPVRIFFMGRPLAGVHVSAMYAGAQTTGHEYPVNATTGADGRARLKLDRGGLWYVRLIHMVPSGGDPDFDWRSFFATLTFRVPE